MILNLTDLKKCIKYKHFKMDLLQNMLHLIKPGVFMASIDLSDAFYLVPVNENISNTSIFSWGIFEIYMLPNGYGLAMKIFPFSLLRERESLSVIYAMQMLMISKEIVLRNAFLTFSTPLKF